MGRPPFRPRPYSMITTYGDFAFYRDDKGRWRSKNTGELAIVLTLKEWLERQRNKRNHGK